MRTLAIATIAVSTLVLTACAASTTPDSDDGASSSSSSSDVDSASHCSAATEKYALSQGPKVATIATAEQLAQAPQWLPVPACATTSVHGTVWVYPVATLEDFDGILESLREQGQDVPSFTPDPEFFEIAADDFYVSFTGAGQRGAPTATIIVNAP